MKFNLSKEIFERYKKEKKVFPFYLEMNGDEITPISIFYNLSGKNKFLLESAEYEKGTGRYSFIGSDPYMKISSYSNKISIENGSEIHETGKILDILKNTMNFNYDPINMKIPFTGGAIGYIGYDVIRQYEFLPDKNDDELKVPEAYLMFYKQFICYDHLTHKAFIVKNIFENDNYQDSVDEISALSSTLLKPNGIHELPDTRDGKHFTSNFTEAQFCSIVDKAKEYIKNGDIFQVVLSQRLEIENHSDPFDVYRRLRSLNPSPYLFYIDFGNFQLAGSSPESLVNVFGDKVITNPIAGTRPRGKNELEDSKLKEELTKDEKERAEHLMLVDLGRNDIGKISEFGSVKMERFMEVDFYSHVMHMVSKISGKLKKGLGPFDALISCLPAGTVSGAPKVRAMEIIDELEKTRRSFYSGSTGYFSYNGNMDMCITIRTILFKGEKSYIQAGAGIVYDSDPHGEYIETLNKLKALEEAI
ncbi:MAG: anthranilate synthase component I [Athalassotoga sp.]|uniref:anthranilate synthase component I n=1 Tax=Athalassotoga sp. TaxID=2022597 RepID=UPI003CFD8755